MKKSQIPNERARTLRTEAVEEPIAFIEHLRELRRRLVYVISSILVFSTLAYLVQEHIVNFLLEPSRGQQFIYTSPIGGINFLFTVCFYTGIILSIPIIIYQSLGFFRLLMPPGSRKSIIRYSYSSGILAIIGFCFGYYVGLPVALHFLSHQFINHQVHALFTIQEYMSFLTIYLLGSALLFQLPIILLFINRIKPLRPSKLLGLERYVIVAAVILAFIMVPTPNVFDQLIIVIPIVLMYNLGILMIRYVNKRRPTEPSDRIEKVIPLSTSSVAQLMPTANTILPAKPLAPGLTMRISVPSLIMDIRPPAVGTNNATYTRP